MLWGTDLIHAKIGSESITLKKIIVPTSIISGVICLAFGFISLIFRRDAKPEFPWGVVILILTLAAFAVTIGVWDGGGIVASVIIVLLLAIPVIPIVKWVINDEVLTLIWVAVGAVVGVLIGGIIGFFSGNYSMMFFSVLLIPAVAGMIIMLKAEYSY